MKKLVLFIVSFQFSGCTKINKNELGEGNGLINDNRKVNALFLDSHQTLDREYNRLEMSFGKPIIDGYYKIYKFHNYYWSEDTVVLRIEESLLVNLDNTEIHQMFITVENIKQEDLLMPRTRSRRIIKDYFSEL